VEVSGVKNIYIYFKMTFESKRLIITDLGDSVPHLNVVVTPKSLDSWCLRIRGMECYGSTLVITIIIIINNQYNFI